jgi:hypothetical protein
MPEELDSIGSCKNDQEDQNTTKCFEKLKIRFWSKVIQRPKKVKPTKRGVRLETCKILSFYIKGKASAALVTNFSLRSF